MSILKVDYGDIGGGGGNPTTGTTKGGTPVTLGFLPSILYWYGSYSSNNIVSGAYFKDISENTYIYARNAALTSNHSINATPTDQGELCALDNTGFTIKNSVSTWANVDFTYIAYP